MRCTEYVNASFDVVDHDAEVFEDDVAAPGAVSVLAWGAIGVEGSGDDAVLGDQHVVARAAVEMVHALMADDVVVAGAAVDDVVAALAPEDVAAFAASDVVITSDPIDLVEALDGAYDVSERCWVAQDFVAVWAAPGAQDASVVTDHDVGGFFAVDGVVAVGAADHVVATDDVVFAETAVEEVAHLTTDDQVVTAGVVDAAVERAVVAVDDVHAAPVPVLGEDRLEAEVAWAAAVIASVVAVEKVVAFAAVDLVVPGTSDDDVVAEAGPDVVVAALVGVGRLCVLDLGGRSAHSVGEEGEAVVAEHQVVAEAAEDAVVVRATEDDVHAAAGGDGVPAAEQWVDGADFLDGAEGVDPDLAVVADDDVSFVIESEVGACVDVVVAGTAQHDVSAAAGHDLVVAGEFRIAGADEAHVALDEDHLAGVADHGVVPRVVASEDVVVAEATDGHVRTGTELDEVVATERRIGGDHAADDRRTGVGGEQDLAVVTDHEVRCWVVAAVGLGVDRVVARAADGNVGAVSEEDQVVACVFWRCRADFADDRFAGRRVEDCLAVVADRNVVATVDADLDGLARHRVDGVVDEVVAGTGDDDVVGFAGFDAVVAADVGSGRSDGRQNRHRSIAGVDEVPGGDAVVASDHVFTWVADRLLGVDDVVTGATECHVAAVGREDPVVATVFRGGGLEAGDQWFAGCRVEDDLCVVASGHVVAVVSAFLDRIARWVVRIWHVVDEVVANAADFNVVAVAGEDDVVAAEVGGRRGDRFEDWEVGAGVLGVFECPDGDAVVTEDDVFARVAHGLLGVDDVVTGATECHVVAVSGEDPVVATVVWIGRFEAGDQLLAG